MAPAALRNVGEALGQRARGDGPGPVRALVAAVAAGTVTAAITYRFLRSGGSDGDH